MLHDAVLFDLDGTLVATDRFWVPAARAATRAAFRDLGLEREPPSGEAWTSIVGDPLAVGLRRLFPDLSERERAVISGACLAEEARWLSAGGAAAMPGALDLLAGLRAEGVRVGLASNCTAAYLEHMQDRLGLGAWVEEARCLESPGVRSKADMVAQLVEAFGTRSAVFVGDRESDRDAAWANGLPHVHCRFGFAGAGEAPAAEAAIEDLGALRAVLGRRRTWIERALEEAGSLRALAGSPAPIAIGITGSPVAGKTLFARDAARVFRARGVPARWASLEAVAPGATGPFDPARLEHDILAPLAAGALPDPESGEPADVLVLEGDFLLDPSLRPRLARVLHLEVGEDLILRRAAGRVARTANPESVLDLHRRRLPAQRAFDARYPPEEHADLVLDASNPLGVSGSLDPRAAPS